MNLNQKVDKRLNQLRSASFNSFGRILQDFWMFFDNEPKLSRIGSKLHEKFPDMRKNVILLESRIPFKANSEEESIAFAYEILRRLSEHASNDTFRSGLQASISSIAPIIAGRQLEIDKEDLLTFKETYLEKFCLYLEEQLEPYETMDTKKETPKNQQNFYGPVGSVLTGNNNLANVNQNIGQNFSEILKQLAEVRNEFQLSEFENREEAIEIVNDLENEIVKEKPNKSKVKAFLITTKDFAVKTGTELAASTLAKLIEGQIGKN